MNYNCPSIVHCIVNVKSQKLDLEILACITKPRKSFNLTAQILVFYVEISKHDKFVEKLKKLILLKK